MPNGIGTSLFRGAPGRQFKNIVWFVPELDAGVHGEHYGSQVQLPAHLGNRSRDEMRSLTVKYFAEASLTALGKEP
ncbi:hypothetical protein GCM10009712_37380 [Pseudarthrobacter sulfonivorans]